MARVVVVVVRGGRLSMSSRVRLEVLARGRQGYLSKGASRGDGDWGWNRGQHRPSSPLSHYC